MERTELIKSVAKSSGVEHKVAKLVIDELFKTIQDKLIEGINVKINGFIHFLIERRPSASRRNPKTQEEFTIPPRYRVKTKWAVAFNTRVRNKTVY